MVGSQRSGLGPALRELMSELRPGAAVEKISSLDQQEELEGEATEKGIGYGASFRVELRLSDGKPETLVFRTARANDFDHDRRSDRAKNVLLAYDTFRLIPRHVSALDVGIIGAGGHLHSLRQGGEFYLLTDFAPGSLYAHDLRRIAAEKRITPADPIRCQTLVQYLVSLHAQREDRPAAYTRAIRNLVGDGEGIFGMTDNYPAQVEQAPPARLQAIEARCVEWRWRLRGRERRLTRTHGDFHPFNILFDEQDELALLDASRGCRGDPADDVTCLAINYVFFALEHNGAWQAGLGDLWRRFWREYLDETGDHELLEVAPPFLAWRALVLANPHWYPEMHPGVRDSLLRLVEQALDAARFDPDSAEALFP